MSAAVPPGAEAALAWQGMVPAGVGGHGRLPHKGLVEQKAQRLPRAEPGARLTSQRGQRPRSPAPTGSRDFSQHIPSSEKPLGQR